MFTPGRFNATYDLYRPTLSTTTGGVQTFAEPATPTASAQGCLFFPTPGIVQGGDAGMDLPYDATMYVPSSAAILPQHKGDQPDHVHVGSKKYLVLLAHDAAGRSMFYVVRLREIRP